MDSGSNRPNLTVLAGAFLLASCGNIIGFQERSTDIGDLPRLDIFVGEDEMGILYDSLTNDAYASCRFDDGERRRSAGIRIRGDSSRMQPKKSFTLVFEEDGEEVKVALDSGGDPWFLYNIAMYAYELVGLPAPQLRPVALFLNDSYLGYYSMIRMYSDDLNDFFGSENGELYKFDHLAQDTAEKKFPDDGDYSLFQQLMTNVEQLPGDSWIDWCEDNINLESTAKYVAVSDYLGIWDIKTKNFYLYFGDETYVLPWDNDHGLCYSGPGGDDPITARLFESPLFVECYRECLEAYFLDAGPDNIVFLLEQRLDELSTLLDTAVRNSPVFYLTYQAFLDEKAEFETFLNTRGDQVVSDPEWTRYVE